MCYFWDEREPILDINSLIYMRGAKMDRKVRNRTIIVRPSRISLVLDERRQILDDLSLLWCKYKIISYLCKKMKNRTCI